MSNAEKLSNESPSTSNQERPPAQDPTKFLLWLFGSLILVVILFVALGN